MSTTSAKRSSPFEKSAAFYDLIHADKDYDNEAELVLLHMSGGNLSGGTDKTPPHEWASDAIVVDYGCGTGQFAKRLARYCRRVDGADPSQSMYDVAVDRCREFKNLRFSVADILSHNAANSGRVWYSGGCCMFGAMSYAAASPCSLVSQLLAIRRTMAKGGRFVFDVVNYAACVASFHKYSSSATQLPDGGRLIRDMTKSFNVHLGIVEIAIRFDLHPAVGDVDTWQERHVMRAFTPHEIAMAANEAGWNLEYQFPAPGTPSDEENSVIVGPHDYYFWNVLSSR